MDGKNRFPEIFRETVKKSGFAIFLAGSSSFWG